MVSRISTISVHQCLLLVGLMAISSACFAQDYSSKIRVLQADQAPGPAKIEDLSWIQGSWEGNALGGFVEETWSAPNAGTMMCSFRLIVDGQVQFYEFVVMEEYESSLRILIKHFNRDMTGWEEKDKSVEFKFISMEGNTAYFDGFTFEKIDDDHMEIYVLFEQKGDEMSVGKFSYTRK